MPRPKSAQPAYQFHISGKVPRVRDKKPGTHQADSPILGKHVTADFRHRVLPDYLHNEAHHGRLSALLDLLDKRHGDEPAGEFGPRKLEAIRATLPHLTNTLVAMIKLQLATAMRPSKIFRMRPSDIDRTGADWIYRPAHYKTEHHGKAKAVPILAEAFKALAPFMSGDENELCFLTTQGTPWNKDSYRIAITRAAKVAKVDHWTPDQIRHTAAQAVRDAIGPEGAQALLGHSRLSTTEIYAKANESKAIEAARTTPKL